MGIVPLDVLLNNKGFGRKESWLKNFGPLQQDTFWAKAPTFLQVHCLKTGAFEPFSKLLFSSQSQLPNHFGDLHLIAIEVGIEPPLGNHRMPVLGRWPQEDFARLGGQMRPSHWCPWEVRSCRNCCPRRQLVCCFLFLFVALEKRRRKLHKSPGLAHGYVHIGGVQHLIRLATQDWKTGRAHLAQCSSSSFGSRFIAGRETARNRKVKRVNQFGWKQVEIGFLGMITA